MCIKEILLIVKTFLTTVSDEMSRLFFIVNVDIVAYYDAVEGLLYKLGCNTVTQLRFSRCYESMLILEIAFRPIVSNTAHSKLLSFIFFPNSFRSLLHFPASLCCLFPALFSLSLSAHLCIRSLYS